MIRVDENVAEKLGRWQGGSHIAREIYRLLTNPPPTPNCARLRIRRQGAGITVTQAARALGTRPARISEIELGRDYNHHLAGSIDYPFNPVSLALGAEASFVARTLDMDRKHTYAMLEAARGNGDLARPLTSLGTWTVD